MIWWSRLAEPLEPLGVTQEGSFLRGVSEEGPGRDPGCRATHHAAGMVLLTLATTPDCPISGLSDGH